MTPTLEPVASTTLAVLAVCLLPLALSAGV
jgi:hypothetical protein